MSGDHHRLIGQTHQCPRCFAILFPGDHHADQAECDAWWEDYLKPYLIEPSEVPGRKP